MKEAEELSIKEIQQKVSKKISLPQGYSIVYGGAYADQQQSFHELLIILITSSLLVFGVILFMFRDYRIALIILLIAALGIAGSFMALYFTGTPLNVGSYTGLIMIVGIIGENAIFTFLQFNESFKENNNADDAVIYAISTRLRPKLMTVCVALFGLVPVLWSTGVGSDVMQPIVLPMIGRVLTSSTHILLVTPLIFLMTKEYELRKHGKLEVLDAKH